MQPGQEAARESSIPSPVTPDLPSLLLPPDGQLVLPTGEQFEIMLAEATQAGKLPDLHKALAALEAMAKRFDVAFEELHRLAVFRLRTERSLGAYLAQTVSHGGDRARFPRGTLPHGLPDWVTKKQSSIYQRLAAIPDEQFEQFLEATRLNRKVPSSAGARRYAAPPSPKKSRAKAKPSSEDVVRMPDDVIDAAIRCLGRCDVVIGGAKVREGMRLDAAVAPAELRGHVLVVECREPAALVAALIRGWSQGQVTEAIAILPSRTGAAWFQDLGEAEATLCMLRGEPSTIIAHLGEHTRGFELVAGELGLLARAFAASELRSKC